MEPNPVALRQDPIVEATFEVRFSCADPAAGDLLPGMLFPRLRGHFGTLASLPIAQLPRAMRQQQPDLAYQPSTALVGQGKRVAFGDRVASVSFLRPYPGWSNARPIIHEVVSALGATGLVQVVERIALKYVNVLTAGKDSTDLTTLRLNLSLDSFDLRPTGKLIRVEIEHRGCIHVVQVVAGADVTSLHQPAGKPSTISGVLVDIDSIKMGPIDEPWNTIPRLLEDLHDAEKDVFFRVLTPEVIDAMHPIYA